MAIALADRLNGQSRPRLLPGRSPQVHPLSRGGPKERLPELNFKVFLLSMVIVWSSLLISPSPLPAQDGALRGRSARPTYGGEPRGIVTSSEPAATGADFQGSVTSGSHPAGILPLSLRQATELGLANNLGLLLTKEGITSSRGQRWLELSRLLPDLSSSASVHHQKESIAITGIPLRTLPEVTPPFTFFDARIFLTQRLFDLEAWKRAKAAAYEVTAAELSEKDAREIVAVAVGAAYLQALAGYARVETVTAQLVTAKTILEHAVEIHKAGVTPGIDELRARVEWLTRTQQLIAAQNELAKQKLALLRLIGLPVGQEIVLTDRVPYQPLAAGSLNDLLFQALASREDYRAAQNLVKAAEAYHAAARAERLPALVLNADYGVTGLALNSLQDTYHIIGEIRFPIFQGGKVHGDVLRAEAQLRQRREELNDLRGSIEFDLRSALLDIQASAKEVEVARENVALAELALSQARERFAAGINDNLEVVQAQQSVAAAHEALVTSQYQHNLAKLMLARAVGTASGLGSGGE